MIAVVAMEGSRTLVLSSLRMPFPFRWSHPTDASITVTIEINSSTVNDPYKRPGCQFNFRGLSLITVTSSTKLICFRQKSHESLKIA